MPAPPSDLKSITALLDIMRALRAPEGGCPWDVEQTFETIVPYTIEEAYEVADAIDRNDPAALKSELGDLLFQVVYHAQMASEKGWFSFEEVVEGIGEKLVRRHPHVFGETEIESAAHQTTAWEEHKAAERAAMGHESLLDDVPLALPALKRALKLQKRAARAGFDWDNAASVLEKITEEIGEFTDEVRAGKTDAAVGEFGDLLFVLSNLARHLKIPPEEALRRTNAKFEWRFRWMEQALAAQGAKMSDQPLAELERLWVEAKRAEKEKTGT